MSPAEFCYWLRGFLEMGDPQSINEKQTEMLKKHLGLVFVDVTKEVETESPEKELLTDSPRSSLSHDDLFDTTLLCSGISKRGRFC